jgi:N-alpha-acetyl-L-2,4-diaminobutyrate deacetylase
VSEETVSIQSLVRADVDFEKEGKQFGNLAVPQSTNSAGWAKRFVPVIVIKNGSGPTAVLFGGNHGDEFEGPVTLMNLARRLQPDQIQGRIILVPMLNHPAIETGTRLSPLDGCNMNRAFPGRPDDSITGMIAHYVSSTILPMADLVVDIHSGGSSTHFLPSVNMHEVADHQQMQKMMDAGQAWGAPYVFIYRDVAGAGLLPTLAEQMGKITLGTEMGSKAQFGVETLNITARGVENVLAWFGILDSTPLSAPAIPQIVAATEESDYIMSPASGLFEPFYELGNEVTSGDAVGGIHLIEHPEREPIPVLAQTDGMVMARRSNPLTRQGEMVITLVRPYDFSTTK